MRFVVLFLLLLLPVIGSIDPTSVHTDLASSRNLRCEEAFGFVKAASFLDELESDVRTQGLSLLPDSNYEPSPRALEALTKLIAKSPDGAKIRWQDARKFQSILFKDWRTQSLSRIRKSDQGLAEKIWELTDRDIESQLYNALLQPVSRLGAQETPERWKFIVWAKTNFGYADQLLGTALTVYSLLHGGFMGAVIPKSRWVEKQTLRGDVRDAYLNGGTSAAVDLLRTTDPNKLLAARSYAVISRTLRFVTTVLMVAYMLHGIQERWLSRKAQEAQARTQISELMNTELVPPTPAEAAEALYQDFIQHEGQSSSAEERSTFRAQLFHAYGLPSN